MLATVARVQFDNRPLNDAAQLLDRGQLRDHLLDSLLHLHAQPPLFNLFIGLGLHAPIRLETPLFHALYLGVGLAIALCLYTVLRRSAVPTFWAVALSVLFCCSPGVFLYESWLHYDYLVVLLLILGVVALQRFLQERRPAQAAGFIAALAATVLTRSIFHLAWLLLWVVLVILMAADRRRVLAAVSLPVLVVLGFQVQRFASFGTIALSSGLGVSLAKITVFQLPLDQREAMVASGELSAVSLVDPLSPAANYSDLVPAPARTGVPVLDDDQKGVYESPPTNDVFRVNMNSRVFIAISNSYLRDSLHIIRNRPEIYLQGVAKATQQFFRPTSDFFTLAENRARVAPVERFFNKAILGVVSGGVGEIAIPDARAQYTLGSTSRTAWTVVAAYGLAAVAGAILLLRSLFRRDTPLEVVTLTGFLWFTVGYIFLVSNLLEVGENNRFRLYSDPLVLLLLATVVMAWRRPGGVSVVAEEKFSRQK